MMKLLRLSSTLLLSSTLPLPVRSFTAFRPHTPSQAFYSSTSRTAMSATSNKPFSVVVQAEINPERMDEFLKMIENNAVNSRKEPQCLRFDVLRDQSNPNKFIFYEVYESVDAISYHKEQDHYKAWADFKESGGVVSSESHKLDGEFMT